MTTYSYDPVDGRDDGTTLADEPRAVVESVGSDASGWTEVSRRYAAHFVENGVRVEVSERASAPDAAYGAAGSQRTVSSYLWNCRGAGRPVRRETPDGLVSLWSYDFTPSNVVVETATIPAQLVGASVPACPLMVGIPYRTTIERTVEDLRGDVLREETYVVTDSGRELLSWTDFERDAAGHELRRESSDGSLVERAWSCCGPEWEMDERGIVTVYSYDALGRQATMTRSGVTTLWNYDLAGNATNVTRFADALMASSSTGYDSAGRLAWNVGEDGVRTEYAYSTSPDGGEVRTTIRAANTDCATTNTVISFRDGATKASYLNNVLKTTEVHELFASATYEGTNGLASARWSRNETDFFGRTVSESRPGFGGSTLVTSNLYDSAGRLASTLSLSTRPNPDPTLCVSAPLRETIYLYNGLNDRVATVSDRNFNNAIDWTGPDLVSSNATRYVSIGGDWWRETRQWSIHDDNSAVARLMGVRRSRVTGLGRDALVASAPNAILASESVSVDQRGNATTNRVFRNRSATEEIAWVKYPTSTTPAVTVSTNGLMMSSTSQTGVTTTFAYDAFQREVSQADGRGNTTTMAYDAQGRVVSTTDGAGNATAYGYDAIGRRVSATDPLDNTVFTAYDAEGRVISQRGATYPVDYAYDEFGGKVSMTTYRSESLSNGDVTTWLRDEATGLVTNKVYADGKGPSYSYTPDGRLATRTWARGVVTAYAYDSSGALTNTVYSDGTPTVSMAYDRTGSLVSAITEGVCTNLYAYDITGLCTNEVQNGVAIARGYDALGRPTGYTLRDSAAPREEATVAYGYDPATGRLISAASGTNEFFYTYLPGTDLVAGYVSGDFSHSISYEQNRDLVSAVTNRFGSRVVSAFGYSNDAAGRRTAISRSGEAFGDLSGSTDTYGYNLRSEVVSARRTMGGASVRGFDEDFSYDPIGNRIATTNYTETGAAVVSEYTANSLNQYTSRTVPGVAAVRGFADVDATVTVNESPTWRLGEYFFGSDEFDNSQSSVDAALVTAAALASPTNGPDEVASVTSHVHIAKTPQLFEYDDDGNQALVTTKTGTWRVTYNGENRPVRWTREGDGKTVAMSFDHMGRRRTKDGQRFFYDGYLQVANERTVSNELVRQSFVWDPTEPVATRPLAWFGSNAPPRLYTHDGNKNVSEVVAVASGTNATVEVVAHYDYAAFGAVIAQKGDCAEANPWRFSSEYEDTELGLDYYNYREYESMVGRWLGYDFVADCLNRYVWCENYTGGFDFLGLKLKVFGDHEQKEKIIKLLQEIFGGVVQLNGDDVVFQGASDSLGCECKKLICEDPTYSIDFDDKADMYGGGMFKPEPFGGVLGGCISLGSKDSYSRGNELVINRAFPFVHLKEVIEDLDDILAHELAHAILHQQQKPNADQKLLSGDPAKNKLEKEARRLTDYVRKGCHK